jgi:hypothetical protein
MASQGTSRRPSALDLLLDGSAAQWLGLLLIATPWLRFELGAWTLYPGPIALSLLLGMALLEEGGWSAAVRPLLPLLALGAYVAAVSALRGELWTAAIALAATALHFAWGAAAFRIGLQGRSLGGLRAALVLLLAATLIVGLLFWLVQGLWPAGCRALNCHEGVHWPFAFTGGWGSAAQYALLLIFLLPVLGGPLIARLGQPGGGRRRWALPALGAAAGLGLLAGGPLWALALCALAWALLARALGPARRDPQRLLLRGLAGAGLFALVLVYGLEPGYLHRLGGSETALPPVRIAFEGVPPRLLSSDTPVPLTLQVRNAGWSALGGEGGRRLVVGLRYLVTPERGATRSIDGPQMPVPAELEPGDALPLSIPVRPPPWVRDGYLTWRLSLADGSPVPLAGGSQPGFRFSNTAYRKLGLDPENQLSSMAARARTFQSEALPPPAAEPDANTAGAVVGDVLDTLFFSPFWGEPEPAGRGRAFTPQRPFLPSLFHRYGLIGLLLGLWVAWRLLDRALGCAERGDPGWMLLSLALALLAAAALFTPTLGTFTSHWAFFLLAGFLEGRYARKFPWPRLSLAPRLAWRFRLPLPWRMGAPRRRHAGRVHR